jgi:hypothetical protein
MKKQSYLYVVYAVTALSLSAWFAGCTELPTEPAAAAGMVVRGVTLADWTSSGYGRPSAMAAVDRIAAAGANRLVIVVTAYQNRTSDNIVRTDPNRTPTGSAVAVAAARAATQGLEVAVKLHVDLYGGEWRGNIRPSNPTAWFESYGAFAQLVIGTELAGTIEHEDRWRALIAEARSRFGGEVVYAASWDEAQRVPFWDAVDRAGVDFYAPVSARPDAGRVEILAGWQPWIERLHLLHRQTGLPVLLTEIGYRSVNGAGMHPFEFGSDASVDTAEQADLYWAALEAVGQKGWIEGVYWWNWLADGSGGASNTDYTPMGKPAEEELSGAWSR